MTKYISPDSTWKGDFKYSTIMFWQAVNPSLCWQLSSEAKQPATLGLQACWRLWPLNPATQSALLCFAFSFSVNHKVHHNIYICWLYKVGFNSTSFRTCSDLLVYRIFPSYGSNLLCDCPKLDGAVPPNPCFSNFSFSLHVYHLMYY